MILGKAAVFFNDEELLVGGGASQASLLRDIRADFYVVEVLYRDAFGNLFISGIPGCLQLGMAALDERSQRIDLLRSLVSAHKANASDAGRILSYQKRKEMLVQRHTLISPEPRAVTTHAVVRTTRDIESKGYLVRNLLTYDIKVIALDHLTKKNKRLPRLLVGSLCP